MELAYALRTLAQRPRALAVGVLIAAVAAILSVYSLNGGKLKARSLQHSSASTQVIVDSQKSVLGNATQPFEPLAQRAWVYANFMTSPSFLDVVGKQVGLTGAQLYAAGPVNVNEPRSEQEPTDLKRNVQITGETKPYRLSYEAQEKLPTITINSQAPTTAQAVALANAAAGGLQSYVATSESEEGITPGSRVVIRQLGPASGAVVDGGISKSLAAMVFVLVFVLWCILVLLAGRFRRAWRESAVALSDQTDNPREGNLPEHSEAAEPNHGERPERVGARQVGAYERDGADASRGEPSYLPQRALLDTRAVRGGDRPAPVPARSVR